jgi:hypothetical protein
MENIYKSKRIVDGKPPLRTVIVDEDGKVINKNPTKEELKGLMKEPRTPRDTTRKYTKEQLLWCLIQFYEENGRPPTQKDFDNNPDYPHSKIYHKYFGSWSAALKLVGLDVESMVKKGVIETEQQKGRFGEILIRDHFATYPVDLAGENQNSSCDGICPNGKTYDVKSSKLYIGGFYDFKTNNKYKNEIDIYYLLGFNEDYTKLKYGWRIPGEIVDTNDFYVSLNSIYQKRMSCAKFYIENMRKYDITKQLVDVLNKYDFFKNKIK